MPPELIKLARSSLREAKEYEEQQKEAGQIFRQIRSDCESLLEQYGDRKKSRTLRVLSVFTIPAVPFVKQTPFQMVDWKTLSTSINSEGEPIQVKLTSSGEVVSKSAWISINIRGLDEYLEMNRYVGATIKVPNQYQMDKRTRTATLNDAKRFREVVDLLLEKNPIH